MSREHSVSSVDDDLDISFEMDLFNDYVDEKARHRQKQEVNKNRKLADITFTSFSEVKTNPHTGLTQNGILDPCGKGIGDFSSFGSFDFSSSKEF